MERADLIAPNGMRRGIAFDAQALAFIETKFVFRMKGGAPPRLGENGGNAGIVFDEQRAGRRAHEDFDARRARQTFEFGNVLRILMRAADPEGEIAEHAIFRPRDLVFEFGGARSSAAACSAFRRRR